MSQVAGLGVHVRDLSAIVGVLAVIALAQTARALAELRRWRVLPTSGVTPGRRQSELAAHIRFGTRTTVLDILVALLGLAVTRLGEAWFWPFWIGVCAAELLTLEVVLRYPGWFTPVAIGEREASGEGHTDVSDKPRGRYASWSLLSVRAVGVLLLSFATAMVYLARACAGAHH
jgi:hypothetical protein